MHINYPGVVKSPRSRVAFCFQFVSAAASAATTTFLSHVKTVSATSKIFGANNI